ncbi:hypothetical protein ACFQU7_34790 [Pseudoroseomonas wenyumeiae]
MEGGAFRAHAQEPETRDQMSPGGCRPASGRGARPGRNRAAAAPGPGDRQCRLCRGPALPACATSARLAAQTLEARGYAVTLREDLSHGEMAAAFRALGQALDRAPGAQAVAYLCTRAVASGGRAFLLPVTARVQRPSDAISQGILASRLAEALDRPDEGDALMLVDAMTGPAGDAAAWQDAVSRTSSRVGLAVALPEPAPETGPAPLAGSLRTLIPDGGAPMVDLSAALRQQLAPRPGLTLVLHAPAVPVPKPPAGPLPLAALQPPALPEAPAAPRPRRPLLRRRRPRPPRPRRQQTLPRHPRRSRLPHLHCRPGRCRNFARTADQPGTAPLHPGCPAAAWVL